MYLDKVMAIDVLSMGQISTTSGKKQYILSMLVSHLFHQTHSLSKLPQLNKRSLTKTTTTLKLITKSLKLLRD